jgi:hypothetical protein
VPVGPRLPPTTEHRQARLALERITGRKRDLPGEFEFTATEVIDLTAAVASMPRKMLASDQLILEHCPLRGPEQDTCIDRLLIEVDEAATGLEQDALLSIAGLDYLLEELRTTPEQKTVLLLSGGMPMADRGQRDRPRHLLPQQE